MVLAARAPLNLIGARAVGSTGVPRVPVLTALGVAKVLHGAVYATAGEEGSSALFRAVAVPGRMAYTRYQGLTY